MMRTALRGAAAGSVGVACMVGVITTLRRGLLTREQLATAHTHPEKVVARLADVLDLGELDDRTVRRAGDAIHFGYGAAWGAVLALATEGRGVRPRHGALLAGGLWTLGFNVLMPGLGIQPGPWTWRGREFVLTLSAHAAYGAGTVGALRLLGASRGPQAGGARER